MKLNNSFNLVADIGGTNARFALVTDSGSELIEARNLVCADYPTIDDAINAYMSSVTCGELRRAAISVASPVIGDRLAMTNHSWHFGVSETRQALGLASLKVLNDYTALALALPLIRDDQCLKVGSGEKRASSTKAAIGPGTGLGVSGIVPSGDHWFPLESEGGHASYGPVSEREDEVIRAIRKKRNHISAESLVSGPGIASIYEAITELGQGDAKKLKPGEITSLALTGQCAQAVETLSMFCEILGTVAGNLALTLGARGGVYLGGGIIPQVKDFFMQSNFRERFEQHGRLTTYLQQIPTYLIDIEYPALFGAMVSLNTEYVNVGITNYASSEESPGTKNNPVRS